MNNETTKTILAIGTFTLALILIFFILNAFYIKLIMPQREDYRKEMIYQDYLESLSPPKEIDFVFFGDSHTNNNLNPLFINNSYNLGTGGSNYIEIYYRLKRIVEKDHVQVNNAILQLDMTSMYRPRDETNPIRDIYLFSKFVSLSELNQINQENIFSIFFKAYFPIVGQGRDFGIFIVNLKQKRIYLGWTEGRRNFLQADIANETLAAQDRYKAAFGDAKLISNISLRYFEKTLEYAKQNNISIIFMRYPHTVEFEKEILENNKIPSLNRENYYNELFDSIENTIGKDYKILDYHKSFSNNTDYFSNPDHLNNLGAEELSKQVARDLQKLGLIDTGFEPSSYLHSQSPSPKQEERFFQLFRNFLLVFPLFLEILLLIYIIDKMKSFKNNTL